MMRAVTALLAGAGLLAGCGPPVPPRNLRVADVPDAPAMRPDRRAYAHVMVSFRNRLISGEWQGWNHTNPKVSHDPDQVDASGRRDLASVYYPLLGAYDMLDPALVEAHCRLAAAAGLDGFFFDVAFDPGHDWTGDAVRLYVEAMQRHGLTGAIVFEDKAQWIWNPSLATREATVEATLRGLDAWIEVLAPVQARVDGRALVGFFSYEQDVTGRGLSRLLPDELRAWRAGLRAGPAPLLLSSWYKPEYAGVLDGFYDWIWLSGPRSADGVYSVWMETADLEAVAANREQQAAALLGSGGAVFRMAGVWPGFDSRGCWGFGGEPQYATRADGDTYRRQWDRAAAQVAEIVQVVTWNDWFEGTAIEPTAEEGFRYLELTRERVSAWKGTPPPVQDFAAIVEDYWRASPAAATERRP